MTLQAMQATARAPVVDADAVRELYEEGLAAFYTERWDDAVDLLRQVLVRDQEDKLAPRRLEEPLKMQRLASAYERAMDAAAHGRWETQRCMVVEDVQPVAIVGYPHLKVRVVERLQRPAVTERLVPGQVQARADHPVRGPEPAPLGKPQRPVVLGGDAHDDGAGRPFGQEPLDGLRHRGRGPSHDVPDRPRGGRPPRRPACRRPSPQPPRRLRPPARR